jgi:hypothetical protein
LLAAINATEYALYVDSGTEILHAVQFIGTRPVEHSVLLSSWRANVMGRRPLRQRRPGWALQSFDEQFARLRRRSDGGGFPSLETGLHAPVGARQGMKLPRKRRGGTGPVWPSAIERRRCLACGRPGLLEQTLRGLPLEEGQGPRALQFHGEVTVAGLELIVQQRRPAHVAIQIVCSPKGQAPNSTAEVGRLK